MTTLPAFIDPEVDVVAVDGHEVVPAGATTTYALYKPRGVVSTMRDEQGRKHLADLVPAVPRVFPVGRLDQESEGLILLTNDGDLALRLAHPRYRHQKRYRVWTDQPQRSLKAVLDALRSPRRIAGKIRAFDQVEFVGFESQQLTFDVIVHEGLKHLVRRLMDASGLTVRRLMRTAHGPVELGSLRPGEWRTVNASELELEKRGD